MMGIACLVQISKDRIRLNESWDQYFTLEKASTSKQRQEEKGKTITITQGSLRSRHGTEGDRLSSKNPGAMAILESVNSYPRKIGNYFIWLARRKELLLLLFCSKEKRQQMRASISHNQTGGQGAGNALFPQQRIGTQADAQIVKVYLIYNYSYPESI